VVTIPIYIIKNFDTGYNSRPSDAFISKVNIFIAKESFDSFNISQERETLYVCRVDAKGHVSVPRIIALNYCFELTTPDCTRTFRHFQKTTCTVQVIWKREVQSAVIEGCV
jgi:hypothetical protein